MIWNNNDNSNKPPVSGLLFMLKSMGLESVIEAAQKMASADTVAKILEFADALPQIQRDLRDIREFLGRIDGIASAHPDAGPGGLVALVFRPGPSDDDGTAGNAGSGVPANRTSDDDDGGLTRTA